MITTRNRKSVFKLSIIIMILLVTVENAEASNLPTSEEIAKITQNWVCKWCPYPETSESESQVSVGAGYVSNDSYKNGDYTGMDEKGFYPIAEARHSTRSSNNGFLEAEGRELGTNSRDLFVSGRNGESVQGSFQYSELPKLNLDTARTPYNGTSNQQLPTGWTAGSDTQNMPQLVDALHDVNIYTNRKTFALAGSYQQDTYLSYDVKFQRDTKEGRRTAGLAFGNSFALARSAILAIPVDYVTDQGEVALNYANQRWQASISYLFSQFENGKKSIRWDNAFTTPATATEGQAALEPDNTMQKVAVSGAYRFGETGMSQWYLAFGQLTQNNTFLPYTVNGSLSPFTLPTESLNGKINTIDATLKILSRVSEQLYVEGRFSQNEQDNDTDRNTYDYIVADTQSGTSRANFPYSFRKINYQLLGRYQLQRQEISLGIVQEKVDRTYQEVDSTTENTLRASYRTGMVNDVEFQLRGARSERDGDKYTPVTEITPPENPLMRKYNMADRDRDQMGISITYAPQIQWQLSAYLDAFKDLYSNSDIGLLESIEKDYMLSLQYQVNKALLLNLDYAVAQMESTQAGSQTYSTATWHAVNNDELDSINLGMTYWITPDKFSMGLEYSYAKSEGKIKVSTDSPLAKLASVRHTVLLYGEYRMDEQSALDVFYRYEDYDESDWANDGVNPDTIANVLSLGEVSPSYRIGILGAAVKYRF